MRDKFKDTHPEAADIVEDMIKKLNNRLYNSDGNSRIECENSSLNSLCRLFGAAGYHFPIGGGGTIHICPQTMDSINQTGFTVLHEFIHL